MSWSPPLTSWATTPPPSTRRSPWPSRRPACTPVSTAARSANPSCSPLRKAVVRRVLLALALVAGALAPVTGASAATDPAPGAPTANSIGIRLVDAPASAKDDPRARVYIVDHLAPGTVIHRRIEVSNTTAGSVHVALYPACLLYTSPS